MSRTIYLMCTTSLYEFRYSFMLFIISVNIISLCLQSVNLDVKLLSVSMEKTVKCMKNKKIINKF